MASSEKFVDSIKRYIKTVILSSSPKVDDAIFVSSETEDANLSTITYHGIEISYIRKCTSESLSAGDRVLIMSGPGIPVTIIGKIRGDTTILS